MTNRQLAIAVIRRLRREGHVAYMAGGCVRDRLLRKRPKDYDVATAARPEDVQRLFPKTLAVGARFGVIVVLHGQTRVEVATFRSDDTYHDGRHPTAVRFTTAEADARRRDFTINAMFYDPLARKTIDHVGGLKDLQRGLVRAVGDPAKRFSEDHLRMLRAVRFTARLGFRLSPTTARAIRAHAPRLKRISGERVRDELAVMLTHPSRADAVRLADSLGLLQHILPEVTATRGCRQGRRAHPEGDVWKHTLACLQALRRPTFTTALAALLHDIGKPPTADTRTGRIHFYRHPQVGADMAGPVAARLRLSAAQTKEVQWAIRHHLDFIHARQMRQATLRRLFQSPHFHCLAELVRADLIASRASTADYRYVMRAYRRLSARQIRPGPLVSGHDLLKMGLPEGPAVGHVLRKLYDDQLDGQLTHRKQALARARRMVREKNRPPPGKRD